MDSSSSSPSISCSISQELRIVLVYLDDDERIKSNWSMEFDCEFDLYVYDYLYPHPPYFLRSQMSGVTENKLRCHHSASDHPTPPSHPITTIFWQKSRQAVRHRIQVTQNHLVRGVARWRSGMFKDLGELCKRPNIPQNTSKMNRINDHSLIRMKWMSKETRQGSPLSPPWFIQLFRQLPTQIFPHAQ